MSTRHGKKTFLISKTLLNQSKASYYFYLIQKSFLDQISDNNMFRQVKYCSRQRTDKNTRRYFIERLCNWCRKCRISLPGSVRSLYQGLYAPRFGPVACLSAIPYTSGGNLNFLNICNGRHIKIDC